MLTAPPNSVEAAEQNISWNQPPAAARPMTGPGAAETEWLKRMLTAPLNSVEAAEQYISWKQPPPAARLPTVRRARRTLSGSGIRTHDVTV